MKAISALLVAIYFLIVVDSVGLWNDTKFFVFQARDVGRALDLLNGHMIFFGPEMTGGGHLPGPFYYLLLALPLSFHYFPDAMIWGWMMVLAAAGAVVGWFFFRTKLSKMAGYLWITHYALGIMMWSWLVGILNISFLLFFSVLALIFIGEAFGGDTERARDRAFIGAGLVLGLAIQIHFSIVALFFAMISLHVFQKRLRVNCPSARGFRQGLAAFALPIAPFVFWRGAQMLNWHFGQKSPHSGSEAQALPTLLHFLPKLSAFPIATILHNALNITLFTVPLNLFVILVALLWIEIRRQPTGAPLEPEPGFQYLRPMLVCLCFAAIPFSYFFVSPIGHRYGMPFEIASIFVTVILLNHFVSSTRFVRVFCILTAVAAFSLWCVPRIGFWERGPIYVLAPIVAYILFDRERRSSVLVCLALAIAMSAVQHADGWAGLFKANARHLPGRVAFVRAWQQIYRQTGWSYEQAIDRLYFINCHMEGDPEPAYREAVADVGPIAANKDAPDGYFISFEYVAGDFLKWLNNKPVQQEIKDGLRNGDIVLGDYSVKNRPLLIPYHIAKTDQFPRHFHDTGEGYNRSPDDVLLEKYKSAAGVEELTPNQFLFHWNECPDQAPYCATGALVKATQTQDGQTDLAIRVIGAPLSQASPWISPTWTQSWNSPYMEVRCAATVRRYPIFRSIGYDERYSAKYPNFPFFYGNNSVIAPFEREFHVPCERISEIAVGRESSTIELLRTTKMLPAQRLAVELK